MKTRKTRPLAFALLLALAPAAALPQVAFAQSADDATTKTARQRFQEGVGFYDKGQFEMARAAFLQAYALRKHPAVLLNLAQSSLKSGHALEAAHYFEQFLKEFSNATEAQRSDANKGLADARTKLGRIDVTGATTGADVFVNDERIGMAPLDHSIDVEPGAHTVRLQGGGANQTIQVTASTGQGTTARFGAAPAPAPAPVAPTPESAPAEPAPQAPAETTPPPAAPPPAPDQPSNGVSHHWGWVVASGAVTVVGFAFAGIMGAEKSSAQSSANSVAAEIVANGGGQGTCYVSAPGATPVTPTSYYAGACSALASDNNNVNSDATAANIGIVVGSVGAAATVIFAILSISSYGDSKSAATLPVTVTPMAGKGIGGMSLSGSF